VIRLRVAIAMLVCDVVLIVALFVVWEPHWATKISNLYQMSEAGVIQGYNAWEAQIQYFFLAWHGRTILVGATSGLIAWQIYWLMSLVIEHKNKRGV